MVQISSVEVDLSVTFGADVGSGCVLNSRIQMKGSREEPDMSHLQNCGHRWFFQSMVRTSPVFPWDSLSSTASSGGLSRFFPRNISRMETMGCKQAPHAVNSGTEILSGSLLGPFNYNPVRTRKSSTARGPQLRDVASLEGGVCSSVGIKCSYWQ